MKPNEPAPRPIDLSRVFQGVIHNRCPRCFEEPVFSWIAIMRKKCPGCGYVFEREPGYFIGAMVFSYLVGAFSIVPTLVIGLKILEKDLVAVILLGSFQVILLAPFLFRFSRLAWMHLDYRADPAGHGSKPGSSLD